MFFSNPQVQAEAGKLFSDRDGVVWAPAQGFGSWSLPVPFGRAPAGVGLLRVSVSSIEGAAAGFSAYSAATVNEARKHGLVSHSTWTRVPGPGESPVAEVIGVDMWSDAGEDERLLRARHRLRAPRPRVRGPARLLHLARRPRRLDRVVSPVS